eukprot:1386449-Pyramimonas_sp.AAC.1
MLKLLPRVFPACLNRAGLRAHLLYRAPGLDPPRLARCIRRASRCSPPRNDAHHELSGRGSWGRLAPCPVGLSRDYFGRCLDPPLVALSTEQSWKSSRGSLARMLAGAFWGILGVPIPVAGPAQNLGAG